MARHFITRITTAVRRNAGTAAVGEFVFDTDLQSIFSRNFSCWSRNTGRAISAEAIAPLYSATEEYTQKVHLLEMLMITFMYL